MYLGSSTAVTGWKGSQNVHRRISQKTVCPMDFGSFLAGGKCQTVSKSSTVSFAEKLVLWQQCGREGRVCSVCSVVGKRI